MGALVTSGLVPVMFVDAGLLADSLVEGATDAEVGMPTSDAERAD